MIILMLFVAHRRESEHTFPKFIVRLGLVRLGLVRLGLVRLVLVRLVLVMLGLVMLGLVRLRNTIMDPTLCKA